MIKPCVIHTQKQSIPLSLIFRAKSLNWQRKELALWSSYLTIWMSCRSSRSRHKRSRRGKAEWRWSSFHPVTFSLLVILSKSRQPLIKVYNSHPSLYQFWVLLLWGSKTAADVLQDSLFLSSVVWLKCMDSKNVRSGSEMHMWSLIVCCRPSSRQWTTSIWCQPDTHWRSTWRTPSPQKP